METRLGMNACNITAPVETFPATHSMMVVTSPMGLQAPPEFAARMTMPPKNQRSCLSGINFLRSVTITMAVVRLSRIAEKKKVMKLSTQRSFTLFVVLIWSVMMEKPW